MRFHSHAVLTVPLQLLVLRCTGYTFLFGVPVAHQRRAIVWTREPIMPCMLRNADLACSDLLFSYACQVACGTCLHSLLHSDPPHTSLADLALLSVQGYYFCGDGARRDKDGFIWITGRVDDVLNVSGHRVGTAEVENALTQHPLCAEAAVIGYAPVAAYATYVTPRLTQTALELMLPDSYFTVV